MAGLGGLGVSREQAVGRLIFPVGLTSSCDWVTPFQASEYGGKGRMGFLLTDVFGVL